MYCSTCGHQLSVLQRLHLDSSREHQGHHWPSLSPQGPTDRRHGSALQELSSVTVGKVGPASHVSPSCQFEHSHGTCVRPREDKCACDPVTGKYEMTMWVDRQLQHSQWAVTLHFGPGLEPVSRLFGIDVVCKENILLMRICITKQHTLLSQLWLWCK